MALDFPANPTDGQTFGAYVWSASKNVWQAKPTSPTVATTSSTPPTSPNNGDIWVNTANGIAFVYYDDGTSTQWMELLSSAVPSVQEIMPSGSVIQTARATAPTGWLLCDGTAVSRTTYLTLYNAIGTTYGSGDGSTTFTLPNLQGKVPVGKNAGTFSVLGATGGAETVTLTVAEMPSHTHTQNAHNHTQDAHNHTQDSHNHTQNAHGHGWTGQNSSLNNNGQAGNYPFKIAQDLATQWTGTTANIGTTVATNQATTATNQATTATNQATTATNQNTGGGGAHNNLQPYIVLNYIIKV